MGVAETLQDARRALTLDEAHWSRRTFRPCPLTMFTLIVAYPEQACAARTVDDWTTLAHRFMREHPDPEAL